MRIEGWEPVSTDPGCYALRRDLDGGAYALLGDTRHNVPEVGGPVVLTIQTAAGVLVGTAPDDTLAAALAWLDDKIAMRVRCVDLDQTTGEPETYDGAIWEGPFLDFIEGNQDDQDTCAEVCALAIGGAVELGGGAGVLTRVERIGGAP